MIIKSSFANKTGRGIRESGSVLLVSVIIAAVLGLTLASYILMTRAQYASVIRSQTWNYSMAVTEAGIEDALAMINKFNGNFDTLSLWTNSYSVSGDNWSQVSGNVYYTSRNLKADGWGTNRYSVYVTNNSVGPILKCSGFASWQDVGFDSPSTSESGMPVQLQSAKRAVLVKTKYDALYAVAMAAIQTIDFNGQNVTTDSFDSANTNYSINGLYPFGMPSMTRSNGDVCSDATIINSISVGNANIKGAARTGPKGTVALGPGGYVTGGIYDDFNVKFPDVKLPSTSWSVVPGVGVTVDGTSFANAILSNGDYWANGLTTKLYVGSNVTCRILFTGDVNLTGSKDEIRIAPGAKVKIYMMGATFKVAGKGVVNQNGNADSLYYYGLPSNTDVTFSGNGHFIGAIYAPQAAFKLGGGGSDVKDFIGASVTKSVRMNGHFNFHYDENLRRIGPGRGYIPVSWVEVAASN